MTRNAGRLDYVDLMKGFGIFFVVWAHTDCPIKDWIYSFHMPLFFIVSGLFFSNKSDFRTFVSKKAKQLLIPFVTFNILGVLARILVFVFVEKNRLIEFSFSKVIGFGYFKGDLYFPNRVTWFLWSLFFIFVMTYFLSKWFQNRRWVMVVISVVLYGVNYVTVGKGYQLPYFLNSILCGQFYFILGFWAKEWIFKAIQSKHFERMALLAIVYVLSYIYFPTSTDIILGIVSGNPLVHFFQCVSALYFIFVACYYIKHLPFFSFWGKNSLIMLGLNLPLLGVIDFVYFELVPRNFGTAFGGVLLIFLLGYPIYYVLNRFLPFSLGKK